jgi:drug/metabolite transporter (DMT)-like permease
VNAPVHPPPAGNPRGGKSFSAANERLGSAFILTDILILTAASMIVKAGGASYPVFQLLFIRALVGFLIILPGTPREVWREVPHPANARMHALRVLMGILALSTNYAAITLLPLALAVTLSFLRPLAMLAAAALLLGERVTRVGWMAGVLGFSGVLIAAEPGGGATWAGIGVALLNVVFGTLAVTTVRKLADASRPLMMIYYTLGLTVFSAPIALAGWVPVRWQDWPMLIALGCLSQAGQYCFLRAHQLASTQRLATLGYLYIVTSGVAGYLVFAEVPSLRMVAGGAVIVGAALLATRAEG